jgi:hypothetical protein
LNGLRHWHKLKLLLLLAYLLKGTPSAKIPQWLLGPACKSDFCQIRAQEEHFWETSYCFQRLRRVKFVEEKVALGGGGEGPSPRNQETGSISELRHERMMRGVRSLFCKKYYLQVNIGLNAVTTKRDVSYRAKMLLSRISARGFVDEAEATAKSL